MKGIIYIRVSSDEQIKGTSLESQEARCRAYCADHQIEIEEVFREEGESANSTLSDSLIGCTPVQDSFPTSVTSRFSNLAPGTTWGGSCVRIVPS